MLEQGELDEGRGDEKEVKQTGVVLIILIQLLAAGMCIADEIRPPVYIFQHNDVSTVANYVLINNILHGIKFHETSDRKALNALNCLKPSILIPNSNEKFRNIVLEGHLYQEVFKTPGARNRLATEEYQYFKLNRWYISVPFVENTYYSEGPLDGGIRPRTTLKKEDFDCEINVNLEDVLMHEDELSGKTVR